MHQKLTLETKFESLLESGQEFEFLVIIDFESTCDETKEFDIEKQEIIEFPMIILDLKTNTIVDEFR